MEHVSNTVTLKKKSTDIPPSNGLKDRANSHDDLKKAFKNLNRVDHFFECCERGGDRDIEIINNLLDTDPKKHIFKNK